MQALRNAGLSVRAGRLGISNLLVVTGHIWGVLKALKRQVTSDGDFRGFHICRWIAVVGARGLEGERRQDEEGKRTCSWVASQCPRENPERFQTGSAARKGLPGTIHGIACVHFIHGISVTPFWVGRGPFGGTGCPLRGNDSPCR